MLIFCVVLFSCFTSSVTLDEDCETRGQQGSCKHIRSCQYAQDSLNRQQQPDICDFEGLDVIVCCPFSETTKKSASPSNHKSLSEIKCEQFYPKPKYPIYITGGLKSLAREFPHMAILGSGEETNKQWHCGGSLISKRFVLTAAHCLDSPKLGLVRWVRLGDLDLSTDTDDADPQDFSVYRRIYNPNYKPPSRYNDIALLQLDRQVALSAYVSPACLHVKKEVNTTSLTASGWGKKEYLGDFSNHLLKINLFHVDNIDCRNYYPNVSRRLLSNGILEQLQVCARGGIGRDTCQGDSGGPLQVKNKERSYTVNVNDLIGITSFGKPCGLSSSPGVYTRVSHYVSWIESIVWPNETWDNYQQENLFHPI